MPNTCDHDAVEQVRGLMAKEDYFDIWAANAKYGGFLDLPENYFDFIDLHENNVTDFRIICRKCHHTTGWMKADAPGYPGVLKAVNRKRWDEIKDFTPQEVDQIAKAGAKRVVTDVKQLFPSLANLDAEHRRPVGGT